MPDISQQMSYLQMLQNPQSENSPMGAMRALGQSIGNAYQGYESRNDEQDLMKTLLTQDATPETIQKFAADHPQMPVQDIYVKSSIIGRQKKAQQMKDMVKTLTNAIASGKPTDEKLIPSLFPDATPDQLKEFQTILSGAQQNGLNFQKYKQQADENTRQEGLSKVVGEATIAKEYPQAGENTAKLDLEGNPVVEVTGTQKVTPKINAGDLYRKMIPYLTPTEAAQTIGKIAEVERKDTGIGITMKDIFEHAYKYTSGSIKKFSQSLDPGDLEKAPTDVKPFEVNVANEIDTILGGMYPGYYTDKEVRAKALAYYATPEGSKRTQALAAQYNKSKAPDIYNFVQTDKGIVPGNVRTGQAGSPITNAEGDKLLKPTPAGEITPLQQIKTLQSALDTAESLYDPAFVGPVAGRLASANRKILGGVGQSDEQIMFNGSLEQARNTLVYLLSGKQINESEYQRLEKQMPSSSLAPQQFKAAMSEFKRTLNSVVTEKQATLEAGGYGAGNAPKSNQPPFNKALTPGASVKFSVGGRTFNIPAERSEEFIKDNPNAKVQ